MSSTSITKCSSATRSSTSRSTCARSTSWSKSRRKLGHRLALDSIAQATLGVGKTSDGLEAIRWWREGKLNEIAEYCCFDVKVTKLVHEYGVRHKQLFFTDRFQQKRAVAVEWT